MTKVVAPKDHPVKCYLIPLDKILPIACSFTSIEKRAIEINTILTINDSLFTPDTYDHIMHVYQNLYMLVDEMNKIILRKCFIVQVTSEQQPSGHVHSIRVFSFIHDANNEQIFNQWLHKYLAGT